MIAYEERGVAQPAGRFQRAVLGSSTGCSTPPLLCSSIAHAEIKGELTLRR
jgi:hypothetical protein